MDKNFTTKEGKLVVTSAITVEQHYSLEELLSARVDLQQKLSDIDDKITQATQLGVVALSAIADVLN